MFPDNQRESRPFDRHTVAGAVPSQGQFDPCGHSADRLNHQASEDPHALNAKVPYTGEGALPLGYSRGDAGGDTAQDGGKQPHLAERVKMREARAHGRALEGAKQLQAIQEFQAHVAHLQPWFVEKLLALAERAGL